MGLYLTLGLLGVLATLMVRRYDLYDREPPVLLCSAAAWGALVMWSMGFVEPFIIDDLVGRDDPAVVAAVAAIFEELGKFAAVVVVAVAVPRYFNDPMDGLVYGAMAGLGAAAEESVFFLELFPPEGPWLPATEVVRLAGHLVMGGVGSFGLGLWRCGHRWRWAVLPGAWITAVAVHFSFDWLVLAESVPEHVRVGGIMGVMFLGFVAFGTAVAHGSRLSREHFSPASSDSVWGWPFK